MTNQNKIIMPKELTVENGAKSIFIGEFKESVYQDCGQCDNGNISGDEDDFQACEFCEGQGGYLVEVPIKWDTIKKIYALAVKELGEL